jgi:4-amino-4-deoxy-L-arabinose transferase-like glycosyltransferase
LPYLSVASFPFLIYSTIIMFDVMLTVFVLGFFLAAFSYLNKPTLWKLVLGGICLGLGGMTKGPVVLIYTFLPLALLAVWEKKSGIERTRGVWVKWFGASFVIGLALVMVWLLDLLFETGPEFFHTLLFTQTIDRINGKMESSHARPFYFYLPLLPVLFLPWLCFPAVWKNAKAVLGRLKTDTGMKFLLLWFAGCAIVFMLISGKQPHYLVPLLPPVLIFMALCLEKVNLKAIKMTALAMVVLICAGQAVAQKYVFPKYDLSRFAQIVADNPEHDWAFVRKYQGELGFLGRIDRHIDSLEFEDMDLWFKQHPDGYMIIRHHPEQDILKYHQVFNMDYRSRYLGIFTLNDKVPPPKNLPLPEPQ